MNELKGSSRITGLFVLIIVQIFCAVFFVGDVIDDAHLVGGFANMDLHLLVELVAALVLFLAIGVEVKTMMVMYRQYRETEKSMAVARGALGDVIKGYFKEWSLTPAERDVAGFAIKGCSIAEIAGMRESAEGTVKTQLNAIYRKADVSGRSQLVSLLIEDLMDRPLV
jgi:DNA-binding CsgD family transcriptional regulator